MTAQQAKMASTVTHDRREQMDRETLMNLAETAIARGVKAGKFQATFRSPEIRNRSAVAAVRRRLQAQGYDVSVDWDPVVNVPEFWIGWVEDGHRAGTYLLDTIKRVLS